MKVLFGMALRQTTGVLESLLRLVGLDWTVPDFNTLSRRQKTLAVNIPYRGSGRPVLLLIDSTGIKVEGDGCEGTVAAVRPCKPGARHARKHGGSKRGSPLSPGPMARQGSRRKIHIGVDEQTLEIRAVESSLANATGPKEPVDGSHVGDAPMLPDLLGQIPADEAIGSVTADGAYDTRKCHDAIADRGAYAVIRPRKNAKPWKPVTSGAVVRNEACGRRDTSAALSGDDGADTSGEAASRRRCTA
jgi:hypothetical protein